METTYSPWTDASATLCVLNISNKDISFSRTTSSPSSSREFIRDRSDFFFYFEAISPEICFHGLIINVPFLYTTIDKTYSFPNSKMSKILCIYTRRICCMRGETFSKNRERKRRKEQVIPLPKIEESFFNQSGKRGEFRETNLVKICHRRALLL